MVLAVVVVLAVGLVVLLVVGNEVSQGEAVVRGHEVDRGVRRPAVALVQVARTGEAGRELAERARLPAPVVADRVAVLAVPLRPLRREVAHLVAARSDVPRLGDQLHLRDHRVLLDEVEERAQPVDLVELSGQAGRQVEAEAVDVHLRHPVAQRVHDQLQDMGAAHQRGVAGPGRVVVERLVLVGEPVVRGVVDPAERQGRSEVVAFGRVVVDDVEDHLDARTVQVTHHRLELEDLFARADRRSCTRCAARRSRSCCSPSSSTGPSR